jgi:hypothetical protein
VVPALTASLASFRSPNFFEATFRDATLWLSIEALALDIAVNALDKLEEVEVEEESLLSFKSFNKEISRSGLLKRPGRERLGDRWLRLKRRARGSEMLLILYITYIELFLQKK